MKSYFDTASDIYSRARPTYPAELYFWLAKQASGHSLVWDSACGTGQASIDLAAYFESVEASDVSETQVAEATPHRKIHYQVCQSEKTPYSDNSFDVVCVAHALHWLDLDSFWDELRRVLKPNGLFVCWGYNWIRIGEHEDDVIDRYVLKKVHTHWKDESRLLWREYKDIDFPLEMMDVPQFELTQNWSAYRVFEYIRSWSATSLLIESEGDQFLQKAWDEMIKLWGDPLQKKSITLPFFVKAGRFNLPNAS
ncbi:class I SAM-dependent methyltransferase [Marinomonas sp. 2405UD68-3]|uniref:class I SAM-dependent methyltransferase n=1 Tax=Marinomonas sp. 2405UD68-3 TaxID=3391835 RepID=UPI0039C90157